MVLQFVDRFDLHLVIIASRPRRWIQLQIVPVILEDFDNAGHGLIPLVLGPIELEDGQSFNPRKAVGNIVTDPVGNGFADFGRKTVWFEKASLGTVFYSNLIFSLSRRTMAPVFALFVSALRTSSRKGPLSKRRVSSRS